MKARSTLQQAFTLVEVMVVLAVVALLAAVAYPSYMEYISRSKRAQARATLAEAAQFMNRFYTVNDRYDQDLAGAAVALPSDLAQSPRTGTPEYRIQLVAANLNRAQFALQAIPVQPDRCGTFQVNESGQRSLVPARDAEASVSCWK
jgi:type IV pilus assembly protein PilE